MRAKRRASLCPGVSSFSGPQRTRTSESLRVIPPHSARPESSRIVVGRSSTPGAVRRGCYTICYFESGLVRKPSGAAGAPLRCDVIMTQAGQDLAREVSTESDEDDRIWLERQIVEYGELLKDLREH
jgi:hypothetical protein